MYSSVFRERIFIWFPKVAQIAFPSPACSLVMFLDNSLSQPIIDACDKDKTMFGKFQALYFIPLQFRTPVRTHLHTANQRPRVLICIQPIHRGWFNPRYKLVRPPLLPSTARGAVGKATCSTALHCLFSGCEFKSSCWLFFCYNKMGNNGVYSVRGDTQMMK